MSKPVANYVVQIRKLEAARVQAKALPRGKVLKGQTEMAPLLGLTWPTLKKWCDEVPGFEDSGAFTRGGNGTKYEFHALKTVDFLLRHFRKEQAAASAKQRRVRTIVGGGAFTAVPDEYSLGDLDKMISLSTKIQAELERQRKLTDADKMRTLLTETFSAMQQAAMRSAMEQDPTGQWPPDQRESFEDAMRNVLAAMQRAARDCLTRLAASG